VCVCVCVLVVVVVVVVVVDDDDDDVALIYVLATIRFIKKIFCLIACLPCYNPEIYALLLCVI